MHFILHNYKYRFNAFNLAMIEEMEKHQEKQSTKKEVKETKTQLAKKKEDKESEMDENEFVLNKIKADKFNSVSPQRVDN